MKDERIHIRITKELKENFYKECENNIQSPSKVIRKLLEMYINKDISILKEEK